MYLQAVNSLIARCSKRMRERNISGFVGDYKKIQALILLGQKVRQVQYITLHSPGLYGKEVLPNVTDAHDGINLFNSFSNKITAKLNSRLLQQNPSNELGIPYY